METTKDRETEEDTKEIREFLHLLGLWKESIEREDELEEFGDLL